MTEPTFGDVRAAAGRLRGAATRTPVLTSTTANAESGAELFFKCENFQRTGAFKFRGAFNAIACLTPELRARGVVAFSSGNHAQAIALAARLQGAPATLVMPLDAPAAKRAATRGYGASVVSYDRYRENREEIAARLAAERGLTVIPPYDHADVIAGQGTAAMELLEETGPLDSLFVCLGGGGLLAGSALSAKALAPGCRIYGVEPAAGNDGQQSLRAGHIVRIEVPATIADGAQTQALGRQTFPILQRDVAEVLTVTDAELVASLKFCALRMKIVVEPTGCLAFAGVRSLGTRLAGQRVGIIVSGGNVDAARLAAYLAD
jgi:threonine dehydratase